MISNNGGKTDEKVMNDEQAADGFILGGDLGSANKRLADAQAEILFDDRLKKMAMLRQGITPEE